MQVFYYIWWYICIEVYYVFMANEIERVLHTKWLMKCVMVGKMIIMVILKAKITKFIFIHNYELFDMLAN